MGDDSTSGDGEGHVMGQPLDREQAAAAKHRVDGMPAETALGNADAAGGHDGTVGEYRNVQNDAEPEADDAS